MEVEQEGEEQLEEEEEERVHIALLDHLALWWTLTQKLTQIMTLPSRLLVLEVMRNSLVFSYLEELTLVCFSLLIDSLAYRTSEVTQLSCCADF